MEFFLPTPLDPEQRDKFFLIYTLNTREVHKISKKYSFLEEWRTFEFSPHLEFSGKRKDCFKMIAIPTKINIFSTS